MKKTILIFIFALVGIANVYAQVHQCGVTKEADALIKQRLMQNRQLFTKQQIVDLMSDRTITYVPISFHSVSNSSGEGAATKREIFDFLCGLNAMYAPQDLQFFIYNQINFQSNNAVDLDAGSGASSSAMAGWKVNGTINITIGRSLNNPSSSWFSPGGDYIFLLKTMMTPQAKTESHEIGHFLTLPHTFYGWEGTSQSAYSNQNVPLSIGTGWNQFNPETVPRTGSQANCTTAGDGFCDTEADYFSDRTNCPYVTTTMDPYGNALDPDESLVMSYSFNSCRTTFSPDQQTAIAMDVAVRSWVTNTPDATVDLAAQAAVVPISPLHNAMLGSIANTTVRLEWTPIVGATFHYLEVYGTILPPFYTPDVTDVIYKGYLMSGDNYFNLSTALLTAGKRYVWRVTPISNYSTCALPSPFYKFEATTATTTDIKDLPIEQQISFDINSNPITSSYILLSIYMAESMVGSIRVYSIEGREVIGVTKQLISKGESQVQLPAEQLPNGIYVAVLCTERGNLQQKLVIQR